MKTQVEALRAHRYGGKLKRKGDRYTIAEAGDLRLFKALRWVTESPDPAPTVLPPQFYDYRTTSMQAEEAPKPQKRKYTRKAKVEE